jgi:hypothetical protein
VAQRFWQQLQFRKVVAIRTQFGNIHCESFASKTKRWIEIPPIEFDDGALQQVKWVVSPSDAIAHLAHHVPNDRHRSWRQSCLTKSDGGWVFRQQSQIGNLRGAGGRIGEGCQISKDKSSLLVL